MKQLRFALLSRCSRKLREARSGLLVGRGAIGFPIPIRHLGRGQIIRPLFQPCHSVAGRFSGLFAALLLAVSGAAQAATVNAPSPSFAA